VRQLPPCQTLPAFTFDLCQQRINAVWRALPKSGLSTIAGVAVRPAHQIPQGVYALSASLVGGNGGSASADIFSEVEADRGAATALPQAAWCHARGLEQGIAHSRNPVAPAAYSHTQSLLDQQTEWESNQHLMVRAATNRLSMQAAGAAGAGASSAEEVNIGVRTTRPIHSQCHQKHSADVM
jgi:hypothetical protein